VPAIHSLTHSGAGTLVVNSSQEAGVATALALGCTVNRRSMFDRKHYFYADMPAGYQITQHRVPLAVDGAVVLGHGDQEKSVRIERLHLEHDSGKSIHTLSVDCTLVDLNRCGVGLMEIVTGPDLRSGDEAADFVQQVILVLRALGTCDGNIAEGSLRVDANVSVRRTGDTTLGTRCEVKNVAGLRFLSKAIEHERQRQVAALVSGNVVAADTRTFDPSTGVTVRIRAKEVLCASRPPFVTFFFA
jgi:aspartyl-tRNA(Asn)/glutamyl-tRNA(Gln) amidotransferase subunit B